VGKLGGPAENSGRTKVSPWDPLCKFPRAGIPFLKGLRGRWVERRPGGPPAGLPPVPPSSRSPAPR